MPIIYHALNLHLPKSFHLAVFVCWEKISSSIQVFVNLKEIKTKLTQQTDLVLESIGKKEPLYQQCSMFLKYHTCELSNW